MALTTKFVKNNLVAVAFVLPNLAINGGIQIVLDVYFGWSGWLSILAWMIGGGVSLEFGIVLSMLLKSNFKLGKWRYSYAPERMGDERKTS